MSERMRITSTPTWIPGQGRHLAAQVHLPPSGRVEAIVVLAPPLAREWAITYRALRSLACVLAAKDIIAVRFAFPGDGDSARWHGDDLKASLTDDLEAVLGHARLLCESVPLSVIGLRMGATLAAAVPPELRGDLLAWEPVAPRRWLRAQSAIRHMSVSVAPRSDLGMELLGALYTPGQVASLMGLSNPGPQTPRCTVRVEADRSVADRLYATDVAHATTPFQVLDEIARWVPRDEPRPIAKWSPRLSYVDEARNGDGRVRHTLTTLTDHDLALIISEPVDREIVCDLVTASGASEPRSGPGGLWTSVSLAAARAGARVIRVDRRGVGECSDPGLPRDPLPYQARGVEDYRALCRELARSGRRPILGAGLCSGSWYLSRAAASGDLAEVYGYNNPVWGLSPRRYALMMLLTDRINVMRGVFDLSEASLQAGAASGTMPSAAGDPAGALPATRCLPSAGHLLNHGIRAVKQIARRVPPRVRRAGSRVGLGEDPLVLLSAIAPQARVSYLFGDDDWRAFEALGGGPSGLAALRAVGREVQVRHDRVLDHGLHSADAQSAVISHLVSAVRRMADQHQERGQV